MMKKSFRLFLSLMLCVALSIPTLAAKAPQLTLELDETVAETGETFSVLVGLKDNPGFEALQVDVVFDEALLVCTKIEAGTLAAQTGVIFAGNEDNDGKASFGCITPSSVEGDGALAELTFRALRPGSASISLQPVSVRSYGQSVSAAADAAEIRVIAGADPSDEMPEEKPDVIFSDVPTTHWAHDYIQSVVKQGLFTGISNTQFGPDMNVTRGMFVTVLYGHAGAPDVALSDFRDVPATTWYAKSVSWANQQGIVSGIGDNSFGPELPITREQLALILYQYAEGTSPGTEPFVRMFYPDGKDVSSWALTAMSWAVNEGLISGKTGNLLAPKATATRAEIAVIMENFVNMSK